MNSEDIYRQVTLPGPAGRGDERGGSEPPSWSAGRTALTVSVLLSSVVGAFWWQFSAAEPNTRRPTPEGQKELADAVPTEPIDLAATDRAIEALTGWDRKSWSQKRDATRVVAKVFELGGVNYVTYVDTNHETILDYLQKRKSAEMGRRAAGNSPAP
ncbi:MAG TPA: hypothetical protein DCE43_23005 [Planctomycetaceae bacterium]|nr:hypothetical protein [Planctomycetaceae bacterium]HCK52935.1 hypothetical protein [Planctomycetaceae bacterium]